MEPATHRPTPPAGLPRAVVFLLLAGALGYAVFLARFSASFAGGSDSSGYFNSARLLGAGLFHAPLRMPAGHPHPEFGLMAFQPLGFIADKNAPRMAPTYPIGLPLHLLAASWVAGWRHASTVVNILAALGTGALLWHLARRLQLSPGWAAAAVAWLWLCPLALFAALQPMSDHLALLWSLAALAAALRSGEHWRWSVLAGVAVSLAVLVRPTNVLLALPLVVALGWNYRGYLGLILGGLPGGIFFCYYNWRVYGGPLATGYGEVWSAFSASYASPNLAHFARWIPRLLTPFVGAALAVPFVRAARRRDFAVLGLWAVLLIGFYAFYYHSGETWWYLRFILPAFPVLILAALLVAQAGLARPGAPRWARAGLLVLLALGAGWQLRLARQLEVFDIAPGQAHYLEAANWAKEHLPPDSAVFCMQVSGALHFYTDLMVVRWDQVTPGRLPDLLAALAEEKRPVYAALYEFETPDAQSRMSGRWVRLTTVGETTFWRLADAPPKG
ncbi:MAG: hypothetical protein PSU94_00710 [Lacunisphaera sp.]|nr:hypothetical protein [Lacunisphaera sp.]